MRLVNFAVAIAIAAMALLQVPDVLGTAGMPSLEAVSNRFQAETPPAQAEIVHLVLDFAPGVWLPLHTHGGPGYATVLEGALTRRAAGTETTFGQDQGWVDTTDLVHQAGNDTASPARIVATFVIPKGATLTSLADTDVPPGPGATTFAEYRFDVSDLPSPMDLVHRVLLLTPGSQIPPHSHSGVTVVTVLQGSGRLSDEDSSRELAPGESWLEPANPVHHGSLIADAPISLVVTDLLPRGAAYSDEPELAPIQMLVPAQGTP